MEDSFRVNGRVSDTKRGLDFMAGTEWLHEMEYSIFMSNECLNVLVACTTCNCTTLQHAAMKGNII